jgi:hypothetical protein
MIQAPMFSKPRAAKSSSTPLRPTWSPISDPAKSADIFWNVFVPKTHWCSAIPRRPSDCQILVGTGAVTIDRDSKRV